MTNKPSRLNIANAITMLRIILVPVFLWQLLSTTGWVAPTRWFSLALFVLIAATDGMDGAIARRRNLVTNLGKILDPIADKVLILGSLAALSVIGQVPWWATIVIAARELAVTVYRLTVAKRRIIPASGGGKLKTILQSITIGLYVSPLAQFAPEAVLKIQLGLLSVVVALTLLTGVQYFLAGIREKGKAE
jgi:CDP-diacylglycerol--glycerol-3-phosphate 3-phosphatidyltransferase